MKRITLTIILISGLIFTSLAQTLTPRVICSGYGSGQGGGIKLNYTIGETFVTTLRSGNTILTQGFHQPEIDICHLTVDLASTDTINICLGDSISAPLGYEMYSWNTGAQTQSIIPISEGWYSCNVTQLNCQATDSVFVLFLTPVTFYADADGDGFGNFEMPFSTCDGMPEGYVLNNTDCNDGDASIFLSASCNDNDPCTVNDIILADCSCAGTVADSDNDGTCDAEDLCVGPEAGTLCDDGYVFNGSSDVIGTDCQCGDFTYLGNINNTETVVLCSNIELNGLPEFSVFTDLSVVSFQWYYANGIQTIDATTNPTEWSVIPGATSSTYTPEHFYAGSRSYACYLTVNLNGQLRLGWANGTSSLLYDFGSCLDAYGTDQFYGFVEAFQILRCPESYSDEGSNPNIGFSYIFSNTQIDYSGYQVEWYAKEGSHPVPSVNSTEGWTLVTNPNFELLFDYGFNPFFPELHESGTLSYHAWVIPPAEYGLEPAWASVAQTLHIPSFPNQVSSVTIEPEFTVIGELEAVAGLEYTYSIAQELTSPLIWQVYGGTIINGQGTNSIVVVWDSNFQEAPQLFVIEENFESNPTGVFVDGCRRLAIVNITLCSNVAYADLDNDGFGNPSDSAFYCTTIPNGYVLNTLDCDDSIATVFQGSICDDNNVCTTGDVILADCSCAGTFADADNDGTCDAEDLCAGPEAGSPCDDNNPCTVNDIILADCSCAGTVADSDNDGTCDAEDLCAGPEPGSACDDGNICTTNDMVQADCSCAGIPIEPQFSSVSAHACGPYSWNNNTYTQSGTYEVTLQNAAGCDSIAQLVLTIGAPSTSTETITTCGSYLWNGTTYSQSGTYTYVSTNNSGCPNTATLNLTINTSSIAATGVSASQTSVNAGTQVTLAVQGGSLGTGASWKWYRSSCGGTFIGTGSSITITANTTDSYFVRAEGTCNTTTCRSVTINVLSNACGPQNVTASSSTICAGASTTLTVTGSTGTGGTWRWYRNGCGSGTCVGIGSSISVSPSSSATYFVRSEGGSCGTTSCLSVAVVVNSLPSRPNNINGMLSGLCGAQNVTYTTSNCNGATTYQWTVPSGATIVSGQGTASITVNFSSTLGINNSCGSAAICVRSGNSCGWSSYFCRDLQLAPSTPGSISGSGAPCRNQPTVYSTSPVLGATSYVWTVPNGYTIQSGQGTTSITVLVGTSNGSIKVRAVNDCGTSTMRSRSVRPRICSSTMPITLELWPNPNSQRVFFAYEEQIPELLEIYDMMGRTVYSGPWIAEFDVTGLSSGIYFVRASSGEESVVKRMEVAR